MDRPAHPPLTNPNIPTRIFFASSSQPDGSTQRAPQASLIGDVVFTMKKIVTAIFRPLQAEYEIVRHSIAATGPNFSLQGDLNKVLHRRFVSKMVRDLRRATTPPRQQRTIIGRSPFT